MRNAQRGLAAAAKLRVIARDIQSRQLFREPRFWGFAILITSTSFAIGNVSHWLLVPYWAAVTWLIYDPAKLRHAMTARTVKAPAARRRMASRGVTTPHSSRRATAAPVLAHSERDSVTTAEGDTPSLGAPSAPVEVEPPPPSQREEQGAPAPARRRRSGARGSARAAEPSPPATTSAWVQVAPGKYVRIENAAPLPLVGAEHPDSTSAALVADASVPGAVPSETATSPEPQPEPSELPGPLVPEFGEVVEVLASSHEPPPVEPADVLHVCTEVPQTEDSVGSEQVNSPLLLGADELAIAPSDALEFDGDSLSALDPQETLDEENTDAPAYREPMRGRESQAWAFQASRSHFDASRGRSWGRSRGRQGCRAAAAAGRPPAVRRGRRRARHSRAPPVIGELVAGRARRGFGRADRASP